MLRCSKCILPVDYPTSTFDDKGVCNFCRSHSSLEYLGAEALKDRIISVCDAFGPTKYHCSVGFSGGRDSTYLLYLLSQELKLNVLAFTMDNGFMPSECMENITRITKELGVDLVVKKQPYLEELFGNHLRVWLRRPSPAMITALCTGCRLGLAKGAYEFLLEYKVPVYLYGATPFEAGDYKTALLRVPVNGKTAFSLMNGYVHQVIKNPGWISNQRSVAIQIREFIANYRRTYHRMAQKRGYQLGGPFYRYVKWEEAKVTQVLDQLGWQRNRQTGSTWRGDCDIATLKLYLYRTLLGYNDKDDALSVLVRDGQLTREEALGRLADEQYIAEELIESLVEKAGVNSSYFRQVIHKTHKPG